METNVDGVRMKKLIRRLGFENSMIVEAKDNAGGLMLFWSEDVHLECNLKLDKIISCDVSNR